MTAPNDSKKRELSLELTKDPSEGPGRIRWNGSYGKFLVQLLRMQETAPLKSTTLSPILLAKLGKSLLKYTGTIGIETNLSKKQSDESVDLKKVDGDAS